MRKQQLREAERFLVVTQLEIKGARILEITGISEDTKKGQNIASDE